MIDRRFLVSELIACGLSATLLPIASGSKSFAASAIAATHAPASAGVSIGG
jgi:hypothetical protein